ncbi:hypothetical protein [Jatrophihabitans fulvus]
MRRLLIVLAALLALGACTSDGGGGAKSPSPAAGSGDLAGRVAGAVAQLSSAHVAITGTYGGQKFSGTGDEKLDTGALEGLAADLTLDGVGSASLVVLGDKRYVKLPPALGGSKPWLVVDASSTNLIVKQVATFVDVALAVGNVGSLGDVVTAARTVKPAGTGKVGGVAVTRYDLVVDPAKLGGLGGTVTGDVPVTLSVDAQNRPVQVRARPTVAGSKADATAIFSKFDAPVTVTAPPAGQIQR